MKTRSGSQLRFLGGLPEWGIVGVILIVALISGYLVCAFVPELLSLKSTELLVVATSCLCVALALKSPFAATSVFIAYHFGLKASAITRMPETVACLLLLWILLVAHLRSQRSNDRYGRYGIFLSLMFFLLAFAGLSTALSRDPSYSWIYYLSGWIEPVLLFLVVFKVCEDAHDAKILLLTVGLSLGLGGVFALFLGRQVGAFDVTKFVEGTTANPAYLLTAASLVFPASLYLGQHSWSRIGRSLGLFAFAALLFVGLIGLVRAFILAAALLILLRAARSVAWFALLVILIAVLAVFGSLAIDYVMQGVGIKADITDSASIRLLFWGITWDLFQAHPVLGVGPGQFIYYVSSGFASATSGYVSAFPVMNHAHNWTLSLLAEEGIITTVSYTLVFLWSFRKLFSIRSDAELGGLASALLLGLAMFLIMGHSGGAVPVAPTTSGFLGLEDDFGNSNLQGLVLWVNLALTLVVVDRARATRDMSGAR